MNANSGEDLSKLRASISHLKRRNESLNNEYTALKKEANIRVLQKTFNVTLVYLLLILLVVASVFLYKTDAKVDEGLATSKAHIERLLTTIYELKNQKKTDFKVIEKENNIIEIETGVRYSLQMGVFKRKDSLNDFKSLSNFRQVNRKGVKIYLLGNYSTYKETKRFKEKLLELGLKDVFIVAYNGDKEIQIKKAKVLSGESQLLKK